MLYLTGPRQAGKTTLARGISNQAGMRYITLDDQIAGISRFIHKSRPAV
ncbi:AAA family ATPase [Porticoccus sp. GXU_MW_L64]